jgi:hypothetical protein
MLKKETESQPNLIQNSKWTNAIMRACNVATEIIDLLFFFPPQDRALADFSNHAQSAK